MPIIQGKSCRKCGCTDRYKSGGCVPCKREYLAKWHAENHEKVKTRHAKWHAENPERDRTRHAKWHAANHERVKTRHAKWYAENPEKAKATRAKWLAENPEKNNEMSRRQRVKKRARAERVERNLSMPNIMAMFESLSQ